MWSDISQYAGKYQSAVLTGMDSGGYPFSWRCQPHLDEKERVLRLVLPAGVEVLPGPACMLWHRHDERLWQLHSFAVRGKLISDETGWYVRPEIFIPGVGIGGWRSYVRFLVNGRRTTRRYLQRHGLTRPKLNWDEWDTILAQKQH